MAVGLKKKRRIQLIVLGFVCLVLGFIAVYFSTKGSGALQFFRSPSQVVENAPPETETFRIGGLVEEGSLVRNGENANFVVTDGGASIPVTFTGILPDLFSEGTGMIGTGKLIDGTFEAREILAKHDENYLPKEVADALKEQGVFKENAQ